MKKLVKEPRKNPKLSKFDKILFNVISIIALITCLYFFLKVLFL